ncbi:hypothetical protein BLNAU_12320 [Blattamonas nauphoetae]|uniref:Uncharacterized protein n=1 Tax=Blattamonas nauphoetae TaxID=2049346 RepID=A0ABQ9XJR5_9EUKA|nr:hypothetical protein BLNAU_12320 [Blattamonas nauphoetae]
MAAIFRSLVATAKSQPVFDDSLEAKAVNFLESVLVRILFSADAFLNSFARNTDESVTAFVQFMVVLISSPSQAIIISAMTMLAHLIQWCSSQMHLALVKADPIVQIINTLNPQSLSFAEAIEIHSGLMSSIFYTLWLSTPEALSTLEIEDRNKQRVVHETVLQQVIAPSETYICHLCMNRFSIMDGDQSNDFMNLLARLLHISPYYHRTMDFILNMSVVLTIPSCLAFIEDDRTIWYFLLHMNESQQELNKTGGIVRQLGKTVVRKLRMEGVEDVIEEKHQNVETTLSGHFLVAKTIDWNYLHDMNLPKIE